MTNISYVNQLKVLLNKLSTKKPSVSPTSFDDELAEKIEWTPKKSGGTNITTHNLIRYTENKLGFKVSAGFKIFISVFFIVGSIFSLIGVFRFIMSGLNDFGPLFFTLFGAVFIVVAYLIWRSANRPRVFDKESGFFWIGKLGPHQTNDESKIKVFEKLENIYAIQLISEYVRSNKSSYYSFELNLVLSNGDRINVIDHGNANQIKNDAKILAEFLDVPLWDAIS